MVEFPYQSHSLKQYIYKEVYGDERFNSYKLTFGKVTPDDPRRSWDVESPR